MKYTVVFDACVLYPAPLRDFLLNLATTRLFAAKWTDKIHDEWIRGVLRGRPDLEKSLNRTRELMDKSVPDALVTGFELMIDALVLPDPDDRHVLAAAIKCGAQAIITFNLKDFPDSALSPYDVESMHPDTFAENQFDLHAGAVISAAKSHRRSLRNPPKSTDEYLNSLVAQGLVGTADLLQDYKDLL